MVFESFAVQYIKLERFLVEDYDPFRIPSSYLNADPGHAQGCEVHEYNNRPAKSTPPNDERYFWYILFSDSNCGQCISFKSTSTGRHSSITFSPKSFFISFIKFFTWPPRARTLPLSSPSISQLLPLHLVPFCSSCEALQTISLPKRSTL